MLRKVLLLVVLCAAQASRPCSLSRGITILGGDKSVSFRYESVVAPCLRLRGGFFNLPSQGSGGAKGGGETATADDFEDADADSGTTGGVISAPNAGAAATAQQDPAAPQPAVSVSQHVAEYALAGSLDGLRSGLGQSVGGQVNVFVSAALQSTARLASLAFASAVCAFQERQVLTWACSCGRCPV